MTTSNVLPKIQSIVSQVKAKHEALEEYKEKLDAAKTELEQAKIDREKNFSFEIDTKVVELEGFISRISSRYNLEKQTFEEERSNKLRAVEELFGDYVIEKWGADPEARELTQRTIESFKNTVVLLNQYTSKPKDIHQQALADVIDEDFKIAFSGLITLITANGSTYSLANSIPLGYDTYQKLYSVGRSLGVKFE
ncbi:hypothetical protein [Streptococcus orisratti]